ncbi:MAG: tRNA threonylcarbamoyladenosine dehydratase [Bacteroidales bacterium]|nr:tRNA threonylcarbamoyladenosine dehydratase [Bacteroidales bacterium]
MQEWLARTELQIGKRNLEKLNKSNVLVVGLGGVGAYAAENICRAGVGKMTIVDGDSYQESNINRQLGALKSSVGKLKAHYMAQRLLDINPKLKLKVIDRYITDEEMAIIVSDEFDYIVDAIDTLSPKLNLIINAVKKKIPIVSSMGSGGKYYPERVKIADISKSYNCKFARIIRKNLHRMGIYEGFKVVYSAEEVSPDSVMLVEGERNKKSTVGTISYMPPVFGCFCASVVINDLIDINS